jgi:hypothetical protein
MMEDQLKVLTCTDADHRPPLPDHHYLGTLPLTAENLAHALLRERDLDCNSDMMDEPTNRRTEK